MKFVLAKCPSCNGDLQIPDDKDFITCMYCASTIKVRDAIKISMDNNLPNLIKLIEEAIKNQNYSEAYDYCNRVLEYDIENYLVWYYKGTVISRLADEKNLRIIETLSCFENALNNCKEEKIIELKNSIKDILYAISVFLFKLNENSIKVIKTGENKVDIYFDNNRKIIQLLKFIPDKLKIEENKLYNEIISLCNRMLSDRTYSYHTIVAGAQQIKTSRIYISEKIKKEFAGVINDCQKSLRLLNPEEYAKRDAKLLATKKKDKRVVIILGLLIFSVFLIIYIKVLLNNNNSNNNVKNKNESEKVNAIVTEYQKGIDSYNDKMFTRAIGYFEKVEENDSNYSSAQNYIIKCSDKLDEQEEVRKKEERKSKEEEKKKTEIEKKYKRIFDRNGWLHEKQNKLSNMGFEQYKTGYEKASDGSQQLAMYYKKYENGFYVHIFLQYSYSLENHYVRVWVEK